jgi:hypothetical protein
MVHLNRFNEKCKALKISNTNDNIIKVKLFPYSLASKALDWVLKWQLGKFSSWFNFEAAFVERFGSSEIVSHLREIIISFKQTEDELLVRAWERFRGLPYGTKHFLRDWMLMFIFYSGLTNTSKKYLDKECGGTLMNLPATHAYVLLDGLHSEVKIMKSLGKAEVPEDVFDDRYEIFNLYSRENKIEEVKKCLVK